MHTRILFSFLKQRFLLIGHALWGLSPFSGIPHTKWAYTERIPFQGQWASFTQYVTLISTWSMAHKISCDASWKSSSPSPKWFLSSRFLNQIVYLFVSGNLRRLRVNYGNYWKRDHSESNQANNFKISLARAFSRFWDWSTITPWIVLIDMQHQFIVSIATFVATNCDRNRFYVFWVISGKTLHMQLIALWDYVKMIRMH